MPFLSRVFRVLITTTFIYVFALEGQLQDAHLRDQAHLARRAVPSGVLPGQGPPVVPLQHPRAPRGGAALLQHVHRVVHAHVELPQAGGVAHHVREGHVEAARAPSHTRLSSSRRAVAGLETTGARGVSAASVWSAGPARRCSSIVPTPVGTTEEQTRFC